MSFVSDIASYRKDNSNGEPMSETVNDTATKSAVDEKIDVDLSDELVRRFTFEYARPHMTVLPEKMSVSLMSPTVLDGTDAESFHREKKDSTERRILPSFATGSGVDESAKRGIATHLLLQFCDLRELQKNGAVAELKRLTDLGFISNDDSERVRIREIELFRKSDLFSEMLGAKKLYRELRFNVRLPAASFTENEIKISAYENEEILVQGVIDCIVESEDGSISIYDYKTDRLTKEELEDYSLAEAKLKSAHKMQLELYALAAERIFGKTPKRLEVYSLPLGKTVSMK